VTSRLWFQLLSRDVAAAAAAAAAVAQHLLANGLAEVLCNVIHRLHRDDTSSSADRAAAHADLDRLFTAVARLTFSYAHMSLSMYKTAVYTRDNGDF